MLPRRSFLKTTAGAGALAALGNLLSHLPAVSAEEAALDPRMVRFQPDIESLVRLLEETPREEVLEKVAAQMKRGLSYTHLLTALLLAGVRDIQPRPVGFKFHAVLVVNSAHLASLASPDNERWLPIFWAINQFKLSQAANIREGDWKMGPVDEAAVPPSHRARQAFIEAMDNWDESAADAAIVGLVRTAGANELFEIFVRYGARDFRDIGHKAIYVANSFRCLEVIGWQHAEPVLRSLAYALLDRSGATENPAKADFAADRPFRQNLELLKEIPEGWLDGKPNADAPKDLLQALRTGSAGDLSALTIKLLNQGIAPRSVFEGLFDGAGELLMQAPGILSLHAMTFTNAIHYAWHRAQNDETRRLLLLQNAAFLPLYRGNRADKPALHIDSLEPLTPDAKGDFAVDEIFAEIGKDRLTAARKVLGYLQGHPDPTLLTDAARRLIFLKGRDAHDYKFSSAVLEDCSRLSQPWRDRLLAASVFYFRGSSDADNELVSRTRAALAG
ncbi:MAG: hypothetical protein JWL90_3461 [Chthoniobacteraceae bacterium]|nr:hypothetical protein [Chthoniobacteraceae bacterium]